MKYVPEAAMQQLEQDIANNKQAIFDLIEHNEMLDEDGEKQQALGADWVGLAISRHFGVE